MEDYNLVSIELQISVGVTKVVKYFFDVSIPVLFAKSIFKSLPFNEILKCFTRK